MCYNKLEEYRQEILRDTKYILLVISLCSFFLVVCIWAAFYSLIIGLAIGCIPLCVILLSLGWIKENNKLNYQISCICKAQCINKLQVIQLVDPKVSFKQKLVFRFHTSFNPHTFYGIKIVDGNKKYYYFFEQNVTLTDDNVRAIKEKITGGVCIRCYSDTCIIKKFGNDGSFFRVKYGKLLL